MKYESDGGPGIAAIMTFLLGSSEALKDRYDFMKFMVFQWLTGRRTVTQKTSQFICCPAAATA
ncbi:Serine/threonine-protein kinase HipA [Serratia liquefaciens]|nr:Serine/threonine-protein kinase HipA [Serratia liquefaciens]